MATRITTAARPVRRASVSLLLCVGLAASVPAWSVTSRLSAQASGQPSETDLGPVSACAGPESHAFDFWPGVWEMESRRLTRDGEWRETRLTWRAETILGGCAFIDFTEGASGGVPMRGMGSRFWDPRAEEWVVTWLSTETPGQLGIWRGTFDEDGRGEFIQETETPNGTVLSRISWYNIRGDSGEWDHAISRDGGETWQKTWVMRMRKVSDEPR